MLIISVKSCIHYESGSKTTVHYDAWDIEFLPRWISSLSKHADSLLNEKLEFYSPMLFNKSASDTKIKALYKLDSTIISINVYRFNSSLLNSNLFKLYFNYELNNIHWTVESPIRTGNSSYNSSKQPSVYMLNLDSLIHKHPLIVVRWKHLQKSLAA